MSNLLRENEKVCKDEDLLSEGLLNNYAPFFEVILPFCACGKFLTIFLNFHPLTSWNELITGKKMRSRIKQRNKTTKKAKKQAIK